MTSFSGGKIRVIRLFPHRAGGQMGKLSQYARYAIQNIQYWWLPRLVREANPDVVLVHSSFHNFYNLLTPVVRYIATSIPVIADIRDYHMPARRLSQLGSYHALIACSLNVLAHIKKQNGLAGRTVHIPVVQEKIDPIRPQAGVTLDKYKLIRNSYLLFAGLIKPEKGIDLLLKTYDVLRARGCSEQLLLVGLIKDVALLKRALKTPGVRILGAVSREELLDLMSCARMNINLSASEGMPRTSLEALALGTQTLLPKGIPEFERYCPQSVACASDPELVATQIENILAKRLQSDYPIEQHDPSAVLIQYRALFDKIYFTTR